MLSGDARPIVIFEKVALGRFSFLIAILQLCGFLQLTPIQLNINHLGSKCPKGKANLPKLRGQKYDFIGKKPYY